MRKSIRVVRKSNDKYLLLVLFFMMMEAKRTPNKKQNDTNLLTTPYFNKSEYNRANISLLLLNCVVTIIIITREY